MRIVEAPGRVLPTLPGMVHGIVSDSPYKIQCDGCLVVQWGDTDKPALQIMFSDVLFNPRRYAHDKRRLCGDCRAREWGQ